MRRYRWLWIALLVLAGWLGMRMWAGASSPSIERGSTLVLRLGGRYIEAPSPSLLARALGQDAHSFVALLSQLAKAERDARIDTVVLRIEPLGIGWGKAQELRRAIGRLREAGHRTIAHLELASFSVQREYFVATAADEIEVVPGGAFPLVGLAAEYVYLGGLWEKFGIDFEVAKAGRYKSAVETLAGKHMSDASREMANSLLDSTNYVFVQAIASARGLSEAEVRARIDEAPTRPSELVEARLADRVGHLDARLDEIGAPVVRGEEYAAVDPADVGFDPVAHFALVYGTGSVVTGEGSHEPGGEPVFASGAISDAIERASKDDDIEAIVLRIDSPGGSALASELMYEAIARARQQSGKPVVASFSDVAASGGYYVASAADAIVAPAPALTGSIGVFALRPVLGGLFEKLGIGTVGLTRGEHADFALVAPPLDEGARARLQSIVSDTYALFLERVASGRSLDPEAVDAVGQGRVWTSSQALERGLIDELGGLHEAVLVAKQAAGLRAEDDVALVTYPPPKGIAEQIADLLQGRVAVGSALRPRLELPAPLDTLGHWMGGLPARTPLLVPPMLVDIH